MLIGPDLLLYLSGVTQRLTLDPEVPGSNLAQANWIFPYARDLVGIIERPSSLGMLIGPKILIGPCLLL